METDPHRWIGALRQSHDQLAALVRPLSPELVRGPSYHAWPIAQVLGHLGSQAEIFMGWVTAAVEGTEPPGREAMQPIWDAWDARSPHEQAADGLNADQRLVERFEALSDVELAHMHLSLFGMELDATGLPRLRLVEHALHTWDIGVARDARARVLPAAVSLLVDTLPAVANRAGKPQGRSFRLRVRTSEPERDLSLRVGEAVELADWTDGPCDGELRITAEEFLRLVYGRLDVERIPVIESSSGAVTPADLRAVFPGI